MKIYQGLGLVGLFVVGCGTETQSTLTDSPEFLPKERAGQILGQLQDNVSQDLPQNVLDQERIVAEIEKQVLMPWKLALLSRDSNAFASLLTSDSTIAKLVGVDVATATRLDKGIQEYLAQPEEIVGERLTDYLAAFSDAEHAALEIHNVSKMEDAVVCDIHFDLRGQSLGKLRQDRGWMSVRFVQVDNQWKIASMVMDQQEILTSPETLFVDVTTEAGLSSIPLFERLEALRRGGYAITVGDIDGDGDADIYVGGWGASNLYANNGDGSFVDVTDKANIGKVDRVKAAALTDLDNDGDKDLVLSRFIDDKSDDLLVYLNEGEGKFTIQDGAITKALNYDRAMPLTVADFNSDGKLDLYVGFPGARDFTYLDAKPNPLNTHGIFMNKGDANFTDETISSGLDVMPNQRVGLAAYPHASVKADFDGDGKVDLMIADDRRGVSQVFKNNGQAQFADVATDSGLNNSAWAMGIAVGDFDNDGLPDVYYSNIDFLAAKRIGNALDETNVQTFHGNRLYRNLGEGKFEDVTEKSGVGWAGEAAAGAGWFDYDNDGDLDLYVLNGLWTGPGDQDLSSLFNQAYISELLVEKKDLNRALAPLDVDAISLRNPGFNNMIIQTLTHFTGDLDSVNDQSKADVPSLSLGGNQRNVLFRNNGDGTFTEVGYLAGVDTIDDGYMPAFADVNLDGKLDLLVRSCDPGTSQYQYPSLRLYKNQMVDSGKNLKITLTGDGINSNRDAVGAKITVRVGEKIMVREIDTVSGASQSEMAAFFGLGENSQVDEVRIDWPSGKVETYQNVGAGSIAYTEGVSSEDSGM
jgi:hypothetical protein